MRRIERLINLIAALLESSRPMTAQEIRENIGGYDQETHEAFRRAFERDKESLRAMGIPIEMQQVGSWAEDSEGYVIPKDKYYLPDLDLEPDELAALKLAAEAVLGAGAAAESGFMKLSVDAPGGNWSAPRIVWGADVAAEQPMLGPLYSAVVERTPIRFEYTTADGRSSPREIEPYGIVHRGGHWYVIGRDRDRDAVRAFKASRLSSRPERVDGSYEIPAGFDPASHLGGEPWEIGDTETQIARVRFSRSMRWWAEQNLADLKSEDSEEGSLEVEMPVANVDAFVSWLFGFGDEAAIVAPDEMKQAVLERLRPFLGEPV